MIMLTIQFFGALRKYATDRPLCLELSEGTSLSNIRSIIVIHIRKQFPDFNQDGLLDDSVFADDSQILSEAQLIIEDATITVLPPVCGG